MAETLATRVGKAEVRLDKHERRLDAQDARLETQDAHIRKLDQGMVETRHEIAEMRATLKLMATKDDVSSLRAHFDEAITGTLTQALNSTPLWVSILLAIVTLAAMVGTFYFAFMHGAR